MRAARRISDHAALGLEFFIAAIILNLILNPTWTAVAATAFTIAIRRSDDLLEAVASVVPPAGTMKGSTWPGASPGSPSRRSARSTT